MPSVEELRSKLAANKAQPQATPVGEMIDLSVLPRDMSALQSRVQQLETQRQDLLSMLDEVLTMHDQLKKRTQTLESLLKKK